MRKILTLVLLCSLYWSSPQANAQTDQSQTPKSWTIKTQLNQPAMVRLPAFDLDARLQDDAQNYSQKGQIWRFGYEHVYNSDIRTGAIADMLPNGDRVWKKRFKSADALSMNMLFSDFWLAQGATIHLYNDDRNQIIGAYTHKNNNAANQLGTSLLKADHIIVELYEPAATLGQSRAVISNVIHGYRDIFAYAAGIQKDLNDAGKCNHDVNCPLGTGWQDQINSVAIIVINGSGGCTGSLINNTANDGTPYFLTANHCLGGSIANWVFRFNWESPTPVCAANSPSIAPPTPYNEVNGGTLLASSGGSDFGLILLNSNPTGDVYYSGWDKSGVVSPNGTGIHHPSGDVKKISRENDPLVATTWGGAQVWQVPNWDLGTTEPGSSGSPLFDNNKRIIGQLFGGGAACQGLTNNGADDDYGRLSVSWTGGGANNNRLSNWLDPNNSGVAFIDGYNPNVPTNGNDAGIRAISGINSSYCNTNNFSPVVTIRNFGANALTNAIVNYGIIGGTNQTFNFAGSLASNSNITVALPFLNGVAGANTFYAYTTMPNMVNDSNAVNDTTKYSFFIVQNGLTPTLYITDNCFGEETSWNVTNANGTVLAQGDNYVTDNAAPTIIGNLCLPVGCYNFNLMDSYGDGLRGNYGGACTVNGDAFILGEAGDTLCNLNINEGNFGTMTTLSFCVAVPTAPTAAIGVSSSTLCEGSTTAFNNASVNATTYRWTFAGGAPATSTAVNPTVSYAAVGTYSVTLVATNLVGSDTIVSSNMVNVFTNNLSTAAVANGNNISVSILNGIAPFTYVWSNGATAAVLSNLPAGNYTVTVTDANGCFRVAAATVGVGVQQIANIEEVNLYPNPTDNNSILAVRLQSNQNVNIRIYSATGQLIEVINYDNVLNLSHQINLTEKAAGLYMIQLQVGSESKSYKLLKK